ncbi:metalloprotease PmbA [Thiolapillus sp.]
MNSVEQLESMVADLLAEARKQGASAADAAVSSSAGLSLTVRLGEVETIEHTRDQGLGISVYFGKRKGSANTTDLKPVALREAVSKACTIARHTSEDECAGLADPHCLANNYPELNLYHPWDLDMEQARALALETEQAARDYDSRISNSEGATLSTQTGSFIYGNSNGFVGGYPSSRHSLNCVVLAQDGDCMQRDYWYDSRRDWRDLKPAQTIGEKAAANAVAKLNGRKLGTCQAPVIFRADIASHLLRSLTGALRGHAQYRRSSFLLDSLEQQIFPDWVTVTEDPHIEKGLASAPFDNEGVATRPKAIIEQGIIQTYLLDSYSACRLQMQTTGNAGGVRNLAVSSGDLNLEQMLREMGSGLLVTELMGQGVNGVTGDYSRGAAGFWVENGEIQYPVEEITIAGNLKEMYRDLVTIGNDTDIPGSIQTGSWWIRQMTIAGN